jgi:hypothetical protein
MMTKLSLHELDGLFITKTVNNFPEYAPLLLNPKEVLSKSKAKGVRIFIREQAQKRNTTTKEIVLMLKKKYASIERCTVYSNEWILAYPAHYQGSCGRLNYRDGTIHRDETRKVNLLSCLVFSHSAMSGGIKIWLNSQDYEPNKDHFPTSKDIHRQLDRKFESVVINPVKNKAVIFDARLLHQSLSHRESYQRVVYGFYIRVNGNKLKDGSVRYKLEEDEYEWVKSESIIPIDDRNMNRKMTLRKDSKPADR